jgi:hypothetical protein
MTIDEIIGDHPDLECQHLLAALEFGVRRTRHRATPRHHTRRFVKLLIDTQLAIRRSRTKVSVILEVVSASRFGVSERRACRVVGQHCSTTRLSTLSAGLILLVLTAARSADTAR